MIVVTLDNDFHRSIGLTLALIVDMLDKDKFAVYIMITRIVI